MDLRKVREENYQFRLALLSLSKEMSNDDIENVKFVLRGPYGDSVVENFNTATSALDACVKCFGKDCLSKLKDIFIRSGREHLIEIVIEIISSLKDPLVKHRNERHSLQKRNLSEDYLGENYRQVLNEMVYNGDKGNWLKCKEIMDQVLQREITVTPACNGRLKLEYAIVEQFQGKFQNACMWIDSALQDANVVEQDGNRAMLYTYAYHYKSIICYMDKNLVGAEKYMSKAKEYGFQLGDIESAGHLEFAEGMLLTLQLRDSEEDDDAKRINSINCYHRASTYCKSAKPQTAGTEWCWLRSITLMAANLAKVDHIDAPVTAADLEKAENFLHLVKRHRSTLNDWPGQREAEILEIEAVIAKRRGYVSDCLRYAEESRQSYQQHGMSNDHCLINIEHIQQQETPRIASRRFIRRRYIFWGFCILLMCIVSAVFSMQYQQADEIFCYKE